jgi:aspartyl-tRNA(Asn)/glutamyl-tRNA(Gln) amidotransferase subunit A
MTAGSQAGPEAGPDHPAGDDGRPGDGPGARPDTGAALVHSASIAAPQFAAARSRLGDRPVTDARRRLPLSFAPPTPAPGTDTLVDPAPAASVVRLHRPPAGPLTDARDALAAGRTTARALVEAALAAIDTLDHELHAIVDLRADEALVDADRIDRARRDGAPLRPLQGIPLTVKDVIDVAGFTTRAGSLAYHDEPAHDATAVARLRAAGAVIVAKTSTHEFALGVTSPQSRNPHDVTRIPGGSSGGSAIAVATGMGLGSLGTDTRASIRVPAALSGVVGFKPTLGRVPTDGVVSLSWTMDHVAPMATSVADVALLLDVLTSTGAGRPPTTNHGAVLRAVSRGVLPARRAGSGERTARRWRIGVPEAGFAGAQDDVRDAVLAALARAGATGADLVDVDRPDIDDFDDANAFGLLVSRAEAAANHRRLGTDLSRCWSEVADQLAAATDIPAVDYLDAQRRRAQLADELLGVFEHVDLLALPTTLVTAPPVDDFADYLMVLARNAIPFSFVGFPAISIPCGRDRDGLPIGLQLVAATDRDTDLLVAAAVLEAELRIAGA